MRIAMVLLTLASVAPLRAAAQDTLPPDPRQAERLRRLVEDRFAAQIREQLGLSDDQSARMRGAMATIAARRRTMELEERALRQALARQLRPGIAANPDSVTRLVDGLTEHRVAYAQTFRDEMRELSAILNPIQRGQYLLLRDRLMQRVQEIRQQRGGPGPAGRPPRG
ncbi:MAG: hypothetical protein ACRENB_09690 [Gemmatimonadales bacterium]